MKNIKLKLSNIYEDIRCLFNEVNNIESSEIKSYEAKPYDVESSEARSNEIQSYEIDYIDIKPYEIKSYEIDSIDTKPHEIKSYHIESNEDYCIENIKNEFNKLSNNSVENNTKDIRYIVDHINNGENLKEIPVDLEDIKGKFIAYNNTLPFGILSQSNYIDLRKMNITSSVKFDDEYKCLKAKSRMMVKSLKPLYLGFLKCILEEELSEEKLLE